MGGLRGCVVQKKFVSQIKNCVGQNKNYVGQNKFCVGGQNIYIFFSKVKNNSIKVQEYIINKSFRTLKYYCKT